MKPSSNTEKARALYRDAIVCDLTLSWGAWKDRFKALERYRNTGHTMVGLTIAGDRADMKTTLTRIGDELNRFDAFEDRYVVAKSVADIRTARATGKTAVMLAFQGSNPLENELSMVRSYYEIGVRWMLIAYNQRNSMADGCHERTDSGLSRLGISLVKEMNRVGMMIDCSHTGRRSTLDIMEFSERPCFFSHSVCRALYDHERNIDDDQIRACALSGGVIGVNGVGFFLNAEGDPTVEQMYRHIDHISQLVGPQHVSIGLDVVYFEDEMYSLYERTKDVRYPSGYPAPPWRFFQPEDTIALTAHLLDRGYSTQDVRGILGENFLRVAEGVWK